MPRTTKKDLNKIKEDLLARRRKLLDNVETNLETTRKTSDERPSDPMDVASDSYEGDLSVSLAGRGAEEIAAINEALEKIDEGTYGKCSNCGTQIKAARLRALPYATLCVKCKEEEERESGLPGAVFGDGE